MLACTCLQVRLGQKLAGWVVGLGTSAFLIFYQWVVEPAAPGSWPVRFFAAAAQGAWLEWVGGNVIKMYT